MMFGLGSIIGPTLGGFLSNPMEKYPNFFGDGIVGSFLTEYPYFLPCGLSSFLILSSFCLGFFLLEETLQPPTPKLNEETPLLTTSYSNSTESSLVLFFTEVSSSSWSTILSFSGQSLIGAIQAELFPIFLATPVMLGGLGFNTSDIGMVMSYGGVTLLFLQLFLYPKLQRKLGTLFLYQSAYLCYIPITILFPALVLVLDSSFFWVIMLALITARTACNVFIATSINILLVDTCPDKHILGKINGIAMACSALVRTFGPTICGITYSWSLSNSYTFPLLKAPFTWMLLAVIAFINFLIARKIPVVI